jgi:hypothetical protein
MSGPYESLDDFCWPLVSSLRRDASEREDPDSATETTDEDEESEGACGCDWRGAVQPRVTLEAPYLAVHVFYSGCRNGRNGVDVVNIAVRLRDGWYVASDLGELASSESCTARVDASTLRARHTHPGEASRLVWRLSTSGRCDGGAARAEWKESSWLVIGIGASGKPSASPALLATRREDLQEGAAAPRRLTDVDLQLELGAGDRLVVHGQTKRLDESVAAAYAAGPVLRFP